MKRARVEAEKGERRGSDVRCKRCSKKDREGENTDDEAGRESVQRSSIQKGERGSIGGEETCSKTAHRAALTIQ